MERRHHVRLERSAPERHQRSFHGHVRHPLVEQRYRRISDGGYGERRIPGAFGALVPVRSVLSYYASARLQTADQGPGGEESGHHREKRRPQRDLVFWGRQLSDHQETDRVKRASPPLYYGAYGRGRRQWNAFDASHVL